MWRVAWIGLLTAILFFLAGPNVIRQSHQAAQTPPSSRAEAIQRLQDSLAGRGHLKRDRATGLIDFVRLDRGARGSLASSGGTTQKGKSLAFLREQSLGFGLTDPDSEMSLVREQTDSRGGAHLTFTQTYKGVPVFAAMVKTHFNSDGDLRAVNGVVVPDIGLNPVPSRTSEEAAAAALAKVQSDSPQASAEALKLDMTKFRRCFEGNDAEASVRQRMREASELGIEGTPMFLVGIRKPGSGAIRALRMIEGGYPYEVFKATLETIIAAQE